MWNIFIFILFLFGAIYNLIIAIKISISKKAIDCKDYRRKYHIMSFILFSLLALSRLDRMEI